MNPPMRTVGCDRHSIGHEIGADFAAYFEFGLHIPAITLLAAVLGAQICAVGREAPRPAKSSAPGEPEPARPISSTTDH